ncbi:hypothetical protein COLO4_36986 [Corchorus olitorius]|uniref:Uncharacterized protein n=1 Tax=Corchorus olitorius TaxID=93759 RepID=A0A1R3G3V5_9ROSI|nr:hypothetical protein COLO4_36986 [Corchorus olitorius]
MTTLQRSSVSFRRQGSSGRIWSDRQIIDPKTGLPNANAEAGETGHEDNRLPSFRSPDEFLPPSSPPRVEEIPRRPTTSFKTPSYKPDKNEPRNHSPPHKVQRCGISGLFRCIGPAP